MQFRMGGPQLLASLGNRNFRFDKQTHGFIGIVGTENLLGDAEASM